MNKFLELISALRGNLKTVATRANEVLARMQPLEQHEKTSPIYAAVQSCGFAIDFLNNTVADINRELDAIDPQAAIEAGAADIMTKKIASGELVTKEVLEKRITDGELIKKEDAQTAANLAADSREKAVRDELKIVETRRKEISTPKDANSKALVTAEIASRISSDVLKADNYVDQVTKIAGRLTELNELGIEIPTQLMNAATDTPLDEAGDGVFKDRLSMVKDIAGKANRGTTVHEPFVLGGGAEVDSEMAVF